MCRVALLEDDADLRGHMARYLTLHGGHDVVQAGTLAAFMPLINQLQIAVLDLHLPDGDGMEALLRVRREAPRAGVIVLTARGALDDRLTGLAKGADQYFVKPQRLPELHAHLAALARRLGFGGWAVDALRRELVSPGEQLLALNETEVDFLATLAKAPGQIIPRKEVVAALGHNWRDYDMRRLDQLVSRLRRRWRVTHGQHLPLRTEHGKGYWFAEGLGLV